MKKVPAFVMLLFVLGLGLAGFAGARTAKELNLEGLEHFGTAYYEATPRKEHGKAEAEYRLAERSFQEAIRSNPNWVEPYLHLGRTYFVQKKYQQAAQIYREALRMAPQRKATYLQLASALEMSGNYQGAIGVLKQLRAQEVDQRSIRILDDFIDRLQAR